MHSPRRSASPMSARAQANQPAKPGSRALHISITCRLHPARHQAESSAKLWHGRKRIHRLFQIEQAEIILPPLAHDRLQRLAHRIRIEPIQFVDLVLQIAGIGRDPDGPLILFRPDTCWSNIPKGLADASACFGQYNIRASFLLARHESS